LPYQIDLVVHAITGARFQAGVGQAAIDQVGRYWICFSSRFDEADQAGLVGGGEVGPRNR